MMGIPWLSTGRLTALAFITYALSREGQEAAAEVGLLPGPPEFLTIALKRLDR